MAMAEINLRALRNEAEWLPSSLDDVVAIHDVLKASGQSDQVTNGIVGWLVSKKAGRPDNLGSPTRSTYRKVLAGLESPLPSAQRSDSASDALLAA